MKKPNNPRETAFCTTQDLDLTIALREIHEISSLHGDLGHEYWTQVANMLRSVPLMRRRIAELELEVSQLRGTR